MARPAARSTKKHVHPVLVFIVIAVLLGIITLIYVKFGNEKAGAKETEKYTDIQNSINEYFQEHDAKGAMSQGGGLSHGGASQEVPQETPQEVPQSGQ